MRNGRVMRPIINESVSDCQLLKVNSRLDTLFCYLPFEFTID